MSKDKEEGYERIERIIAFIIDRYWASVKEVERKYNVNSLTGISDRVVESIFREGACLQFATMVYNLMNGDVKLVTYASDSFSWHILVKYKDKYFDVLGEFHIEDNPKALREWKLPEEEIYVYVDKEVTAYGKGEEEFYLDEVCYDIDKNAREKLGIPGDILIEYSYEKYKEKKKKQSL